MVEYGFSYGTALFDVELGSIEIVAMQRGAERPYVIGNGCCIWCQRHIIAVHKIDILPFESGREHLLIDRHDRVPAHVRHLLLVIFGAKTFHIGIENTQAIDLTFFGVAAHELHADADAQNGLFQVTNQSVQPTGFEIGHRRGSLSYAGEYHLVGRHERLFVIGEYGLDSHTPQCTIDRIDVAGVVFDNSDLHGRRLKDNGFVLIYEDFTLDMFFDGVDKLEGGVEIKDHHDHRMVMAFAVAATVCARPVTICGCESIDKSYPAFFEDLKKLGGKFEITED